MRLSALLLDDWIETTGQPGMSFACGWHLGGVSSPKAHVRV